MSREPEAADLALTPLALERGGTTSQPVIVARGEIDVATSPLLRSELASVLAQGPDEVTLDLHGRQLRRFLGPRRARRAR